MKQITVLAATGSNVIAEVTEILADAGVNIDSIAGENYGAQAIVNVTVDDEDAALYALQKKPDWQVMSEDAVLVRIEDEVGALAKLSKRLSDSGIVIRSLRFVERCGGTALVAVSSENPAAAREVLGGGDVR